MRGRDVPGLSAAERALLSLLGSPTESLPEPADWAAIDALAERLWLQPRLAARAADHPQVPPELRDRWLAARRSTAARNLLFQHEEANLLRRLHAAGVEAIPLKGTSLARLLGDVAARPVTDIDLGLRAADVARAAQSLLDAGYSVALPIALLAHPPFLGGTDEFTSEVKCTLDLAGTPLLVELHWKWLPLPEPEVWRSLHSYAPSGVRSLGPEHYFLFLCSHAAGGNWAGLRWLCDIAEFLQSHGEAIDPSVCMRCARAAGLRRAAGVALELLDVLLGFRFAPLEPLRDPRVAALAARCLRSPFRPFLTGSVPAIHRDRLRLQDGPARRLAYVARLLRPTFQEWTGGSGNLRSAAAAWTLRFARLGRMGWAGAGTPAVAEKST